MTGTADAVRIRRAGDRALLVEPAGPRELGLLVDALDRAVLPDLLDYLPAATTVLVTTTEPARVAALAAGLRTLIHDLAGAERPESETRASVVIPVRYDGADLPAVAELLGITPAEVIERHTGQEWRCAFVGFTAGFGYLRGERGGLTVPRRAAARIAVPAGAVALADGFGAVYPRRVPGGWQLIGTTDAVMWSLDRASPALVTAGTRVRFVEVE
jgi:KipI family sensor histidine kinase inhibitor